MAKKHWIIQWSEDGRLLAAQVTGRGGHFHCSAVEPLSQLDEVTGYIDLSLESSDSVVLVEEFPEVKEEILQLQIRNRLDQLAVFNVGESVSIAFVTLEQRRQKRLLSIVAQPDELTVESISALAASGSRTLGSCAPVVAAVAALLKQLGPDPFIVLLITPLSGLLLGVRNGLLLFSQTVPLTGPAEVDSGVAAHAISFGRQTLQREFDIDSCRLVCLGEGRESFDFEGLEEENWIPDWSHCLSAQEKEIVLYPGLFGSLFVQRNYSLLSTDFRIGASLKKAASILAFLSVLCGAVLLFFSFQCMQRNTLLGRQLESERGALARDSRLLGQMLPDRETVAHVKAYLSLVDKVGADPSAALILREIAWLLPANVQVVSLNMERDQPSSRDGETETALPVPGQNQSIPGPDEEALRPISAGERLLAVQLVTSLKCVSRGGFTRVKARFIAAAENLARRFKVENIDWNYSDMDEQGVFRCELRSLKPDRNNL